MMSRLPTEEVVLLSADSTVQPGDSDRYPTEMLNSLQPQGIPAHKLVLRPGAPLRLMRNLNPKDGLCNGTRMLFVGVINNKVCSLLQCIESLTENDIPCCIVSYSSPHSSLYQPQYHAQFPAPNRLILD